MPTTFTIDELQKLIDKLKKSKKYRICPECEECEGELNEANRHITLEHMSDYCPCDKDDW